MDVKSLHRRRIKALLSRFFEGSIPIVVLDSKETAAGFLSKNYTGGQVVDLPGYAGRAFIWSFADNVDRTSLWVTNADKDYRKMFQHFAEMTYGPIDWTHFKTFDVDHLRARAMSDDDVFLRVELVPRGDNRSAGAGIEKKASHSPIEIDRGKVAGAKLTGMMAAKLLGLRAPRSMDDGDRVAAIETAFAEWGLTPTETRQMLQGLLQKAAKR